MENAVDGIPAEAINDLWLLKLRNRNPPLSGNNLTQRNAGALREKKMLEYVAFALFGLVMIGCMLYVTISPEVEKPPSPKRPDPKQ